MRVSDERGLGNILSVAKEAGDRTILLGALRESAQLCHLRARSAADRGELAIAQVHGKRAAEILNTVVAVRDHNAHGQLAVEQLLVAMRSLPIPQEAERE